MRQILPFLLLSIFLISTNSFGQNKQLTAYQIYNHKGKRVQWKKLLRKVKTQDIVFIGELHNNALSHWMQYQLISSSSDNPRPIKVGAEMFETDNQILIDEYFQGLISKKNFESEARLWNNYSTDYSPILNYAKENNIPFIATNIPRRYASAVYRMGDEFEEKLSTEAKKWICPLPFKFPKELDCYKGLMAMTGHGGENLAKAQAIKDATMGYFILKNYQPGDLFFHLNGNQHSINREAIVWYLLQSNPNLNILTIHTETNSDLKWQEDYEGKADYIFVVDETIPTTY